MCELITNMQLQKGECSKPNYNTILCNIMKWENALYEGVDFPILYS